MALTDLLILVIFALILRIFSRGNNRSRLLLPASILAIFWLQPSTPIRFLDFWLPVLTLFVSVTSWILTAEEEQKKNRQNHLTAGYHFGVDIVDCFDPLPRSGKFSDGITPTQHPAGVDWFGNPGLPGNYAYPLFPPGLRSG